MYAGLDLLHRRALPGAARHHRQAVAGVAVARPTRSSSSATRSSGCRRATTCPVVRPGGPRADRRSRCILSRSRGVGSYERPRRAAGRRSVRVMAATPIVQAEHLSKWYGQVSGLNDVTVAIPPGITGLLGPNGAGKSTFMKLMTGQLKPSQGTIRVLGEPLWGNPQALRPHRLLPRAGRLLRPDDRPRVGDGAGPAERPRRRGRRRRGRAGARAQVDLIDAAGKKIGAYSKGMRQRVKLAQALVARPRAADPRRAAHRHGSAAAPQDHPADQGLGARRASTSSSRATSCTRSRR